MKIDARCHYGFITDEAEVILMRSMSVIARIVR